MGYKLVYTEVAERDLRRLPESEAHKILKKVGGFMKLGNPLLKAKKLKNFDIDTYRFRVGDYRVIFRKDKGKLVILVVLKIVHRKDAYK